VLDECRSANWDLEVNVRDLQAQVTDSQSSIQRLESEHKRLTKSLTVARDTGDQHKNESERLQNLLEEMKSKHETDIAQARKHAAGLARDKSDLQQNVDTLKAEVARAGRRIPRFGSPLTPGGPDQKDFLTPAHDGDGESDVFGTTGRASTNRRNLDVAGLFPPEDLADFADSPDPSPVRKPFLAANHPSNEIEALQQRLAHAQRQINTLKGTLNREKQLRMRLEGSPGGVVHDEDEEDGEDYVDENTAIGDNKRATKKSTTPFKVGGGRGGRGRGRGRGGITLIQRLGLAAASPSSEFNDDDDLRSLSDSPPPPVPSIPIHFSQADDDEDEVSQFFGSSVSREQQEEQDQHRSPSPPPIEPTNSNRNSVDGMDPAFANVLRRVPSNGSYTGSPLRQAVLGRSARGGAVSRRARGGVPFREARPPSIVDAPEVLAAELGGVDASPLKGPNASLLEAEIIEEGDDGEEYIRVKRVEKVEFGCQTDNMEDDRTIVLPEPPVVQVALIHAEIGTQSEPEAELPNPLKAITAEMALQTEPEHIVSVEKFEMGIQHAAPEPVAPPSPILVENGVGTDPLPEAAAIGKGLPPLIIGETGRRTTITQSDVSISSSTGDSTITRSFLVDRQIPVDEELDEGEETETGAETEDDYLDARQSIGMSTPSDDFHSIMTMTDNDYSDSEDDAESIKASRISSMRDRSSSSLNRPHSPSSYYAPIGPIVTYETVGVGADLYEPPSPVVVEKIVERIVEKIVEKVVERVVYEEVPPAPKPEVTEMSTQTEEWKPPVPVVPIAPLPKPIASPTLIRVGSGNHQFQFIPPSSTSSNGLPSSGPAPVFTAPSPVPTPVSGIFRDSSGTLGRRTTMSDRRQSIESMISLGGTDDAPSRSRVPSSSTTGGSILLNAADKTRPPMMSLPPPPKAPPPPNAMPPPNFIPERRFGEGPPPRPSSPPPAELIQRATTPLGSILAVPGGKYGRTHGSSMPPSQANLRQLPSTSSFRSAANAAHHASIPPSGTLSSFSVRERERRETSNGSLTSDRSIASPRSSMSSERHIAYNNQSNEPTTPNKTADITPRANNNTMQATDPVVIHAITQTMIGEFLYKYTRKAIGKGVGERRHKRFFWVHPYTKTLYWSSADPGSSNVSESSAKSGMPLYQSYLSYSN